MLRFHEVMMMFSGLKQAAKQRRDPTEVELDQAVEDMHKLIASVVDSLTTIAQSTHRIGL